MLHTRTGYSIEDQVYVGEAIFDRLEQMHVEEIYAIAIYWYTVDDLMLTSSGLQEQNDDGPPEDDMWVEGLLITPCCMGEDGGLEYQRVGVWGVTRKRPRNGEPAVSPNNAAEPLYPTWIHEFPIRRVTLI